MALSASSSSSPSCFAPPPPSSPPPYAAAPRENPWKIQCDNADAAVPFAAVMGERSSWPALSAQCSWRPAPPLLPTPLQPPLPADERVSPPVDRVSSDPQPRPAEQVAVETPPTSTPPTPPPPPSPAANVDSVRPHPRNPPHRRWRDPQRPPPQRWASPHRRPAAGVTGGIGYPVFRHYGNGYMNGLVPPPEWGYPAPQPHWVPMDYGAASPPLPLQYGYWPPPCHPPHAGLSAPPPYPPPSYTDHHYQSSFFPRPYESEFHVPNVRPMPPHSMPFRPMMNRPIHRPDSDWDHQWRLRTAVADNQIGEKDLDRRDNQGEGQHGTRHEDSNGQSMPLTKILRDQIEYYFCEENLKNDSYLKSQMDAEGWVDIHIIASFRKVKQRTEDINLIREALQLSDSVELQEDKMRKKDGWSKYIQPIQEHFQLDNQ